MSTLWGNLPPDLLSLKQWCIADTSGAPLSIDASGKLYSASVTDSATFLTVRDAAGWAMHYSLGIGFVLTPDDGYACIDLDVVNERSQLRKGKPVDPSKWTTQEQFNRYSKIIDTFDTYTERSRNRDGMHVWARGFVGDGKRRDNTELYSQFRFIICTGDTIHWPPKPIAERQKFLDMLRSEMIGPPTDDIPLVELPPTESDDTIWVRASTADNRDKFRELCYGTWQGNYPSQSEADFALLSILAFYTQSNEQVRRMFRVTNLGKRDKAVKDNKYIDRSLISIRARMNVEQRVMSQFMLPNIEQIAANLLATTPEASVKDLVNAVEHHATYTDKHTLNVPQPAPADATLANMRGPDGAPTDGTIAWPPGFAGAMAYFIYQTSARPVKEIAIISALGMLAGMCGRAYTYSYTGLNIYIILIAQSGVGKEGMHLGISRLIQSVLDKVPAAAQFVDFTNYASGSALAKQMAATPSFVNVCGEWGKRLKKLAANEDRDEGGPSNIQTVMTDLYQKSGKSSIVGGIGYSNKEQNSMATEGVAYSMIGESTPGTFYESLTRAMMSDGFLSRFTVIQYAGRRPPLNIAKQVINPDEPVSKNLASLAQQCVANNNMNRRTTVGCDQEAQDLIDAWEKKCDDEVNSTGDEARRQMWSRASLKTMRIAALLAIADNYIHPVIQKAHAEWALDLIQRDIQIMTNHLEEGDVGVDDGTRNKKLLALCEKYVRGQVPPSLKIPAEMIRARVVPQKYFAQLTSNIAAFTKHKLGANIALESSIKNLLNNGHLFEISKQRAIDNFNYNGRCYTILTLD